MRFIKYEKKNGGRGSQCLGCDAPASDEIMNCITFKDTVRPTKRMIFCNSCAVALGGELITFSGKKGYPVNIILGVELRQLKNDKGQRSI